VSVERATENVEAVERGAVGRGSDEELLGPAGSYELGRALFGTLAVIFLRARGYGSGNVPNGPVILVLEGGSRLDRWLAEMFIRRHVEVLVGEEDDAALSDARQVLARGGVVAARADGVQFGRLALASGAAIVPVVLRGLPHRRVGWFSKLTVSYGSPFAFAPVAQVTPGQARAVIGEVRRRVQVLADGPVRS
jgi:1-acyl-sn-glycerol-3-phosphate acyltransferase